ncbi:hypothetical protein [Mammaliicoccus vitulinus]|uniref:hypothetical protein n=1 Tax=Mammaliicoccus vitulinus TaxID=71237 RepID=UPI001865FF63|nr:hypothetical protein [Mammaliicoccus vitulinus]
MRFKTGDRVHVTKLKKEVVDFYATLERASSSNEHLLYRLKNCTNSIYENDVVWKEDSNFHGVKDYYTLATDEEDTDKPEIQYISDMYNEQNNDGPYKRVSAIVNLDDQYIIKMKKDSYVQVVTSNYYFRFTENIKRANVYEDKSDAIEHAELIGGRVLNLKRYVEVE